MSQTGRNLTDPEDKILKRKRYLHDRDPLFTAEFLSLLADAGIASVKLPPRSPDWNAPAERFVRTIRILSGASDLVRREGGAESANATTKVWTMH